MAMSFFSNKMVSRASHVLKQFVAAPTFTTTVRTHSSDHSSDDDREIPLRSFGKNYRAPDDDRDEVCVTHSGDQITLVSSARGRVPGTRSHSDMIETEEAFHIRIDAHGLGREDVKVTVEWNVLFIKAGAKKDSPASCKFEARLDMAQAPFKIKEARVDLTDGVLYVEVPKVMDEA